MRSTITRRLRRALLPAGTALALATLAASGAAAATATTSFNVTLTVLNQCVVTATPMIFGSVGLVGQPGTATSTLTVVCTAAVPFAIGLNAGTAPGATIERRLLRGTGATPVAYTLYQDDAYSTLWGDTAATDRDSVATGLPQLFTVYGRLLPDQGAAATGAYTDTIGVTVTY